MIVHFMLLLLFTDTLFPLQKLQNQKPVCLQIGCKENLVWMQSAEGRPLSVDLGSSTLTTCYLNWLAYVGRSLLLTLKLSSPFFYITYIDQSVTKFAMVMRPVQPKFEFQNEIWSKCELQTNEKLRGQSKCSKAFSWNFHLWLPVADF